MISQNFIFIFLMFILCTGVRSDRKVTAELNPGCGIIADCSNNNIILVHVKAEGKFDTLHHLWDFSGKPSVLLALTDKNATINVSYRSFSLGGEGSVTIEPPPKYTYGVVIDQLIEFNDEENSGILNINNTNSSYVTLFDTKNFDWQVDTLTNTSGDAILTIKATEYFDKQAAVKKNGTVRIVMSAFSGEDHAESLPHLLHSGNASQLELTLDNLAVKYKNSRFGLQLLTASSDNPDNTVIINPRKTMDDEHAPGIFTIVEMVSPSVKHGDCGGYLQWRPVVYTSPTKDMTGSMDSVQYGVVASENAVKALNNTLLYSALGAKLDSMLVLATNITFGNAGEGYYSKNQFASWTMLMGYGHPPEEHFSMLVTMVLLIGLGVPAILILTGTICIVLRRLQRNKDDLFLSR